MIRNVTAIRVRYADTDQMKQVYYGKFFEYFEQGRSDLLRTIGLPYTRVEEMGLFLPVIEAHADYKRPARYDDMIEIVTFLRERPVARVRLDYEVRREGEADPIANKCLLEILPKSIACSLRRARPACPCRSRRNGGA